MKAYVIKWHDGRYMGTGRLTKKINCAACFATVAQAISDPTKLNVDKRLYTVVAVEINEVKQYYFPKLKFFKEKKEGEK